MHQRLRDEQGLAASVASFRRYVAANVPEEARRAQVTVWSPRAAEAGEQAQIDYGMLGRWLDTVTGTLRRSGSSPGCRRGWCRNMFRGTYSGFCARLRYVADGDWSGDEERIGGDSGRIMLAVRGMLLPLVQRDRRLFMLEEYFVKPSTIDRIRGSWVGSEIEAYVAWLTGAMALRASGAGCRSCLPSAGSLARGERMRWVACQRMSSRSWLAGSRCTRRAPARAGRWPRRSAAVRRCPAGFL